MTATYIYGTFGDGRGLKTVDGTFYRSNILPAVRNTDKAHKDVTGEESLSLNVARSALPKNWKTVLVTGKTLIAEIDGDKVLASGYLNKINSNLNGSVTLIVNGFKKYTLRQQTNPTYNMLQGDPNAATVFRSDSGYSGLAAQLLYNCFSVVGIPEDAPKPANVLGRVEIRGAIQNNRPVQYSSLYSALESYGAILDNITTTLSDYGVEVWYNARIEDTGLTSPDGKEPLLRMVWDVIIGEDFQTESGVNYAHINEDKVYTVSLKAENLTHKASAFGVTYSVENTHNRIIGHSRLGDKDTGTGADITTHYKAGTGLPRFDYSFSSQIELTEQELRRRLKEGLNYTSEFSEAFYTVEEDWNTEWLDRLGSTLIFDVDDDGDKWELKVRCISLDWSASNGKVSVGVMVLLPRYTSLPKNRKEDENAQPLEPARAANEPNPYPPNKRPETPELAPGWNAMGLGEMGQLGIGVLSDYDKWAQVQKGEIPASEELVQIFPAMGGGFAHGITADGKVYGWGDNSKSQLGLDGVIGLSQVPVPYRCELFRNPIKQIVSVNISYRKSSTSQPTVGAVTFGLSTDGRTVEAFGRGIEGNEVVTSWRNLPAPLKQIAIVEIVSETSNTAARWVLLGIEEGTGKVWMKTGGENEEALPVIYGSSQLVAIGMCSGYSAVADTSRGLAMSQRFSLFDSGMIYGSISAPFDYQGQKRVSIYDAGYANDVQKVVGGEFLAGGVLYFIGKDTGTRNVHAISRGGMKIADWAQDIYLQDDGTLWKATAWDEATGEVIGFTKYTTSSKVSKVASNGSSFYVLKR